VRGALDREGAARARWVEAEVGADAALRAEVERLLAADAADHGPLDRPLAGQVALPDDALDPRLGTRVGPYVLRAVLGRGGMGSVYRAERDDGGFEQTVAVKLLHRSGDDSLSRRRFAQERQILVRLQHPHIARFLDGGVGDDGQPWYALELIDGEPITRHVENRAASLRERLALLAQVCDAVQFAHQNLVLHRDLKPANILVDRAGQVKLLDFGIAKLLHNESEAEPETRTGTQGRAYTPDYAAPEQIRGDAVSTATDLYALGVVAFELLTGRRPFRRGAAAALLALGDEAIESPSRIVARDGDARRAAVLRGDLDTIVLTCLQPDPARRYASAAALKRDIERYLAGLPIEARPDSVAYRASKFVQRHRVAVAAAALLVLGLLVTTTVSVHQARRAERESARATVYAASLQRERDNALEEVRRQETLREHFIVVINRATQGDAPLTSERLLALVSDTNLLGRFGDVRMQSALQVALSDVFLEQGDYPRTVEMIEQLAPLLDRLPDRVRIDAEANRGEALIRLGRLDEADAAFARAQSLLTPEQRASGGMIARLLSLQAQIAHRRGALASSQALAQKAADLAFAATDASPLARGTMLGSGSTSMLLVGDLDESVRLADLADRVWREAGVSSNLFVRTVATQRANALFLRGDLIAAEAAILRINADDSSTESIPARAARDATQAKLVALLARPDAALALVERATRGMCAAVGADSLDCLRVRLSGVDSRALAGRADLAHRELDAVRPLLATQPQLQASAEGFSAVLALRLGPSQASLARVLEIIPAGAAAGALPRRNAVRSLLMLAEAMRAAGHADHARRLAHAALETADDAIDGNGMDRRLLDLWRAELAAEPMPSDALDALAAAIGVSHPFVASRRRVN
jgi:tetratricopeptide (TPR) repeat protein